MKAKVSILMISLIVILLTSFAQANQPIYQMASKIPFFRGANLCAYQDAFSQTRTEYLREMVRLSQELMMMGAYGTEAQAMLQEFSQQYDRNQAFAARHDQLSLTLESTFKAYLSQIERSINPLVTRLNLVDVSAPTSLPVNLVAYGVYSLAPNCRGDIQVTLHIVSLTTQKEFSFVSQGLPKNVMGSIASQVYTQYQRTQFPTQLQTNRGTVQMIGAANGSVAFVSDPRQAQAFCEAKGARLPEDYELEAADVLGDWSGGVSLNDKIWALKNNYVYASYIKSAVQSRIMHRSQISSTNQFYYYCVKN